MPANTEAAVQPSEDTSSQNGRSETKGWQNLALCLAYDGSGFQGWQIQPHGETVQGRLEAALRTMARQDLKVYGSGRTDAGVHALNQVANFHLPPEARPLGPDLHTLRASLNALAGPHISVKGLAPVPAHFHARHRARGKWYRYQVYNRPYPPVFGRQRTLWLRHALDVDAMRAAAAHLLGEHDFSAFRAIGCEARHPVRELRRLALSVGEWSDATLRIDIEASAFLQHMARIIVGTLIAVGQGRLAADEMPGLLQSRRRELAGSTVPGAGLHLMRVYYDLDEFPELAPLLDPAALALE